VGVELLEPLRRRLWRRGLDHQLIVIGDGPMRAELEIRCPEVSFVRRCSDEERATIFASADLFVYPSERETAGQMVLEAQACGLPVVVADRGGAQELVRPDRTGFLCRSGDVESFAGTVVTLLRQPALRAEIGGAARADAERTGWAPALEEVLDAWRAARAESRESSLAPGRGGALADTPVASRNRVGPRPRTS
jgi:glycosyltransferase involved in cell wall biosynthesis